MFHLVFSGRNDTHGGESFAEKIYRVLTWNTRVFVQHGLPHTFWFIEWGREPGQPWLSPKLAARFAACRCIMVPDEIVAAAQEAPVLFQEFTAKNIGIARAQTGLVIATNSDILFSAALVETLKNMVPQDGQIYRAPRHDFSAQGVWPADEREATWTAKHDLGEKFTNASGDFTAATPATWALLGGYCESPRHVRHLDSELVTKAAYAGMPINILPPVYHRDHPESTKFHAQWRPCWGEEDEGLRMANRIMPRCPQWGHRDCSLVITAPQLACLERPDHLTAGAAQ